MTNESHTFLCSASEGIRGSNFARYRTVWRTFSTTILLPRIGRYIKVYLRPSTPGEVAFDSKPYFPKGVSRFYCKFQNFIVNRQSRDRAKRIVYYAFPYSHIFRSPPSSPKWRLADKHCNKATTTLQWNNTRKCWSRTQKPLPPR